MRAVSIFLFAWFGAGLFDLHLRVERAPIVWIAAGTFTMGSSPRDIVFARALCRGERERLGFAIEPCESTEPSIFADEVPAHRVYVSAYGIDRTEVTVEAYRRCVLAGRCAPPSFAQNDERYAGPDLPVTSVTFSEASAYCAFVHGRLPTEAEWERAARGDDARRFPWGNAFDSGLANHGKASGLVDPDDGFAYLAPVGSYPDGASPFGVLDLAGNAAEWTADAYVSGPYPSHDAIDPEGASGSGLRVVRGGAWDAPAFMLRSTSRAWQAEGARSPTTGFRCAHDPVVRGGTG